MTTGTWNIIGWICIIAILWCGILEMWLFGWIPVIGLFVSLWRLQKQSEINNELE
jgi:hypothetical protein